MHADSLAEAAGRLRAARRVVVFTGAGISAECGIPTFRDSGGFWQEFPPETFATWKGILRVARSDPGRLIDFVLAVIEPIARATPGPAHRAIAGLENHVRTTVITQNIDELHQDAGSTVVHDVHGSLFDIVSVGGRFLRRIRRKDLLKIVDRLHRARRGPLRLARMALAMRPLAGLGTAGAHRPGLVLFGDALPPDTWAAAESAAADCDLMLTVGTSGLVYPAAGLPQLARSKGATLITIDPSECGLSDIWLRGAAGEIVPKLTSAAF
jgi:NAD-dependent deacetylase